MGEMKRDIMEERRWKENKKKKKEEEKEGNLPRYLTQTARNKWLECLKSRTRCGSLRTLVLPFFFPFPQKRKEERGKKRQEGRDVKRVFSGL